MADGYTKTGLIDTKWWDTAVAKGKDYRKKYAREENWEMWRRWHRGQWNAGNMPSNIYFKIVRTFVPRVYYRNPSVSITPTKPGDENMIMCKLIERADNKLIDQMKLKESMKRAVLHGFMFGTGGVRLGYGAEFTPTPDDLGTAAPDTGGRRRRRHVEYNDLVHPNMPWVLPAHPGSVVVPDGCSDMHSARWVCYEQYRDLDDVKNDPRFKNTDTLGEAIGDSKMLSARARQGDRSRSGVLLREIRDKKSGTVFVYAPYANQKTPKDRILFEGDDDLQHAGRLNYYPLIFNADDEVFWGIPLSQILMPIQLEKNETRTAIMRHRRVAIAKMLYNKGAITPDELSKLIDGNANGAIQVSDINAVREMTGIQIPPGLLEEDALMDRESQELMGLGVNQFGEYAPGSADRSATESNIVNQATQIRMDENRDTCADLLVDLTTDMNHTVIDHWTTDIVLDILGPAGVPVWVKFHPKMMKEAEYDMHVDPDTSLPLTKQYREAKATQAYAILKTNPLINPMELTRWWLNEMYGVFADSLMLNPMMNTSPQNPMEVGQVAQQMQNLPKPNGAAMAQFAAAGGGAPNGATT